MYKGGCDVTSGKRCLYYYCVRCTLLVMYSWLHGLWILTSWWSTRSTESDVPVLIFDVGQIHVGDLLAPGQKWYNYDTTAQIVIDKINTKNATFAGVYQITKEGPTSTFPFRGEFDPAGVTIGWVVSYWNDNVNYHSLGAWTGYAKVAPESQRPYLSMSRSIAHQDSYNTTSGYGTFSLWSN